MQQGTGILKTLEDRGVIKKGHFKYTSGLHGDTYLQMALALQDPILAEALCKGLAANFSDERISVVVGPATGGIIVAYEVARQLGTRAIFSERLEGKMVLRRGFQVDAADRVLVVEDVVTTGGTTLEVAGLMEGLGAHVAGIGSLVLRGRKPHTDIPFRSLISLDLITYNPDDCPLCSEGVPLYAPGSRGLGR